MASPELSGPEPFVNRGGADVSWFYAVYSGCISAEFITLGTITKQELFQLQQEVATVSALVWFAGLSWAVELREVFQMLDPKDDIIPGVHAGSVHTWARTASYALYIVAVCASACASVLGVHNNMLLMQISESKFRAYMERTGNASLRAMCIFFLCGLWLLVVAFGITQATTILWPYNMTVLACSCLVISGAIYLMAYGAKEVYGLVGAR